MGNRYVPVKDLLRKAQRRGRFRQIQDFTAHFHHPFTLEYAPKKGGVLDFCGEIGIMKGKR